MSAEAERVLARYRDLFGLAGVTALCLDLSVPAAEMGRWEPDRIRRFFAGVAVIFSALNDHPPE